MSVVDMCSLYACLVLVYYFEDYTVGYCCFGFGMGDSGSYFVYKMGVGVGYWGFVELGMGANCLGD